MARRSSSSLRAGRAALLLSCALLPMLLTACAAQQRQRDEWVGHDQRRPGTANELIRPEWIVDRAGDETVGRLSPDGRQLVFSSDAKGSADLWLRDMTTDRVTRLTRHQGIDTDPAWSPDGRSIAFVSMRQDAKGDIYLLRIGDNEEPRRLTDAATADGAPVFSANGRELFFTAGGAGKSRVEKYRLQDGKRLPVSGWGSDHPATSGDGKWLAYSVRDTQRRWRIALRRLSDNKVWLVTTGDYHCLMPTFGPGARDLYFVRFYRGKPYSAGDPSDRASLWRLPLARAIAASDPAVAMRAAAQLTSDAESTVFPQAHRRGLLFSARRSGQLDLALLPLDGMVPRSLSAAQLLALARRQTRVRDRLLLVAAAADRDNSASAGEALYVGSRLAVELGETAKARVMLERLRQLPRRATNPAQHAAYMMMARIELAALTGLVRRGDEAAATRRARASLAELDAIGPLPKDAPPRVVALLLLRRGDLLRASGDLRAALGQYEQLLGEHRQQRDLAAAASLGIVDAMGKRDRADTTGGGAAMELIEHYLALFSEYPEQRTTLRQAAEALLALYERLPAEEQVEQLRGLISKQRRSIVLRVMTRRRLAELYHRRGQLDLAVNTLAGVTSELRGDEAQALPTGQLFAPGKALLEYSDELRRTGQLQAAQAAYARALDGYRGIMELFRRGDPAHERARRTYLRLALADAAQRQRAGAYRSAGQLYAQLIALDPQLIAAHRGSVLCELAGLHGARREQGLAQLKMRFEVRLKRRANDYVGRYGLAYLETLREPLSADDLERAEDQLRTLVAQRPDIAFGHMTLGWIYEMRARLLREKPDHWLTEALHSYERADELNDGSFDPVTRADLLTNLVNVTSTRSDDQLEVDQLCQRRQQLAVGFLSTRQQAHHLLVCGRAATAAGRSKAAAEQLGRARDLARELRLPGLEAQLIARLAYNDQLSGAHDRAAWGFQQAIARFRVLGATDQLAKLSRARAYSLLALGRDERVLNELDRARLELKRYGTTDPGAWLSVDAVAVAPSTHPLGFSAEEEQLAQIALREIVFENQARWPEVVSLLQRRLARHDQLTESRADVELKREGAVLQTRLGHVLLQRGDRQAYRAALRKALQRVRPAADAPTPGAEIDAVGFALEVALSLDLAEELLGRADVVSRRQLVAARDELAALEQRRTRAVMRRKSALLPARLRLALWNDLALLMLRTSGEELPPSLRYFDTRGLADRAAGPQTAAPLGRSISAADIRRVLEGASQALGPAQADAQAVRLLAAVVRELRPAQAMIEPMVSQPLSDGVYGGLHRALTREERERWYLEALLNLARASAALSPRAALAAHPSTRWLTEAAALCTEQRCGTLRHVLAVEVAARRGITPGTLQAMRRVVDEYVAQSPLLLSPADLFADAQLCERIFEPALASAAALGNARALLALSEQRDRRAFAQQLVALPPAGRGPLAPALDRLLAAAAELRALSSSDAAVATPPGSEQSNAADKPGASGRAAAARQDPTAGDALRARAVAAVADRLAELQRLEPDIAALFTVGPFPEREIQHALASDEVAIAAVGFGRHRYLVAYRGAAAAGGGPSPTVAVLDRAPSGGAETAGAVPARLASELRRLAGDAKRVYLDLSALERFAGADRQSLRPAQLLGQRSFYELTTLWQLLDARAALARFAGVPGPGTRGAGSRGTLRRGLLIGADDRSLTAAARARGFAVLPGSPALGEQLRRSSVELAARVAIWHGPVRFDGAPTNLRLGVRRRDGTLQQLRPAQALGLRLPAPTLLIDDVAHSARRPRAERIALARLLHALGVATFAVFNADKPLRAADLQTAVEAGDGRAGGLGAGLVFSGSGPAPAVPSDQAQRAQLLQLERAERALSAGEVNAAAVDLDRPALTHARALDQRDRALDDLARSQQRRGDLPQAVAALRQLVALRLDAYQRARREGAAAVERDRRRTAAIGALRRLAGGLARIGRQAEGWRRLEQAQQLAEAGRDEPMAVRLLLQRSRQAVAADDDGARATRAATEAVRRAQSLPVTWAPLRLRAAVVLHQRLRRARDGSEQQRSIEQRLRGWFDAAADDVRDRALQSARVAAAIELSRTAAGRGDHIGSIRWAKAAQGIAIAAASAAETASAAAPRGARRRSGAPLLQARLQLSRTLQQVGAFDLALTALGPMRSDNAQHSVRSELALLAERARVLVRLGRKQQAAALVSDALARSAGRWRSAERAQLQRRLGAIHLESGNPRAARRAFEEALAIDRESGDLRAVAIDLRQRGATKVRLGLHRAAIVDLSRAVQLAHGANNKAGELAARAGLGRASLAQGAAASALEQFSAGSRIADELQLAAWRWRFRLWSGRALHELRRDAEAERTLREAVRLVPVAAATGGWSRDPLQPLPDAIYEQWIDVLANRGDARQALAIAERLHRQALQRTLLSYHARTAYTGTSARAYRVRALLAPEQIQRVLATRDAALISYYPTATQLLVWTIDRRGIRMRRVPVARHELEATIARFREQLLAFELVRPDAQRLYDWLLRPALAQLGQRADNIVYIVAPHALRVVPFAALHDGRDFAVAGHTFSFAASANALAHESAQPAQTTLTAADAKLRTEAISSFSWSIDARNPLPFAAREAESLRWTYANARLWRDGAATRERLRQAAHHAVLLHVATHAQTRPQQPLGDGLRLADGELTSEDVLQLEAKAQLVVLSACDTGLAPLQSGAEHLSLREAFLLAGAQRVVSSLWRVSDLATGLLMKHYFRALAGGDRDPSAALRRAQLQLRKRYPHPAFWAGFRVDEGAGADQQAPTTAPRSAHDALLSQGRSPPPVATLP